jgi:hypothetical protein
VINRNQKILNESSFISVLIFCIIRMHVRSTKQSKKRSLNILPLILAL